MALPKDIRAFTLIELLVSVSIFAMVSSVVASMYVTAFRVSSRTALENQVIEDSRFALARIAQEISESTIDYDEYYSHFVLKEEQYGQNYGSYNTVFHHPGRKLNGNTGIFPTDIGVWCNTGVEWQAGSACVLDRKTTDKNTGQNPYAGSGFTQDRATAVCDETRDAPISCVNVSNRFNELYLISEDGEQKTIFTLEKIGGGGVSPDIKVLSLLQLTGYDTNRDEIADTYACAEGFICTGDAVAGAGIPAGSSLPSLIDLSTVGDKLNDQHLKDFIPLSSLRLHISKLEFYISPLEDPRRAFNEVQKTVQQQPHVTIVMEVQPNPELVPSIQAAEFKTLRLQKTVVAGSQKTPPAPVTRTPFL